MRTAILAAVMLAASVLSAAAQMCTAAHCSRNLINACDPRCCDLPPSCVRGGPIRVEPPHLWIIPRFSAASAMRGGIRIK
jgi:hypothetical protein